MQPQTPTCQMQPLRHSDGKSSVLDATTNIIDDDDDDWQVEVAGFVHGRTPGLQERDVGLQPEQKLDAGLAVNTGQQQEGPHHEEVRHSRHRSAKFLSKFAIGLSERRIEKMFDRFHRPELLRTMIGSTGRPNWSMMPCTNPVNAADAQPRCRSHCAHLKQAACIALDEPKTA